MSWASAIATVVLPIPPGPLSVMKRSLSKRCRKFLQNVLPSDHPLQAMRQEIGVGFSGAPRPAGMNRRSRVCYALHRSDKAIAAARYVRDIARTLLAIAERLAKLGDVHPQIDFLDDKARPRVGQKFILRNHLARATDQQPQDIHRPAAQLDRHTILLKQPRLVVKGERSEGGDVCTRAAPSRGSRENRSLFQARSLALTRRSAPRAPIANKLQKIPAICALATSLSPGLRSEKKPHFLRAAQIVPKGKDAPDLQIWTNCHIQASSAPRLARSWFVRAFSRPCIH